MPRNKIEDLRNHLFSALESLSDETNPMDLERAQTIANVGQVLVNSIKVENDYLRITGASKSTAFSPPERQLSSGKNKSHD